jgi:CheY-like chemotaxis protein
MRDERFSILIVEDSEADVYLMKIALKSAGLHCDVTVIDDGANALRYIRNEGVFKGRERPDAAVLDLNLPKAEGAAILEALRKDELLSTVPVLVLTSSASPVEKATVEKLGVERFMTKPPDLEEFLRIGEVIGELCKTRIEGS